MLQITLCELRELLLGEYLGLVGFSVVDSTEFENLVNGLVIFGRYLVSLSPQHYHFAKLFSFPLMMNELMTKGGG